MGCSGAPHPALRATFSPQSGAKGTLSRLEAWTAAGFNLMFPLLPDHWINFMRDVVPELRRRGLVGEGYGAGTLRERLGLERVGMTIGDHT